MTVRKSEIVLARLGEPIELVLGYILRQPIAAVFGEVELPQHRVPVHSDDLPNPSRHDFRAAAVEIDTAELGMGGRRHADIARCADVEIELVVGTNGEEFPAVRLVLGQIVVDHDWLGRVIEVVLDLLNLRDLRELADVEGAVGERETVRPIESRVKRAKRLAGRNRHGKVAYGTEAGLFALAGIPTVVIGPGSINQAHKADEYIAVSQLEACSAFLDRLIAYSRA